MEGNPCGVVGECLTVVMVANPVEAKPRVRPAGKEGKGEGEGAIVVSKIPEFGVE
jgi:hypothetical protein